jgi:ketosteroid isomerase-like protein
MKMNLKFITVLTILILFFHFPRSNNLRAGEISIAVEKKAIEQTIHASIGWALNKDKKLLFDSVVQDSTFFIFHPDSHSTIVGFEPFRNMVEKVFMNEKFRATDYAIKQLRMTLSASGEVAWFSCLLDDHGEWDGQKSGWDNVRWTGVLEKRAGKWVIMQMHFSFASDK